MTTGNPNPKIKNRSKILLGAMILIICFCVLGYQALNSPRYIELPIQPPNSGDSRLNREWSSVEYTIESYTMEAVSDDRFYSWRVKKTLIVREAGFNSWESIAAYFHDQLTKDGWIPDDRIYGNRCYLSSPESNFLPQGINGYRIYKRQAGEYNTMRYYPNCLCGYMACIFLRWSIVGI